jgi:hypothetical protein
MSYLIYTSLEASNGLIPQPGRAVNTFPSGLVRVDQTYLGLTSNAATHRAILAVGNDMPDGDSAPCIDGLKIFPEAQERRREDGFTEYIVSAYGRVSALGKTSLNYEVLTFSLGVFTGIYKQTVKTIKRVLLFTQNYDFTSDVSGISSPEFIDGYDLADRGARWGTGVRSYESSGYGHFQEITVVIAPYKKISIT